MDEAHLIDHWGHDFRPNYSQLGKLKDKFKCQVVALTATATESTIRKMITSLHMQNAVIEKLSCIRTNIKMTLSNASQASRNLEICCRIHQQPAFIRGWYFLFQHNKGMWRCRWLFRNPPSRNLLHLLSRWTIKSREKAECRSMDEWEGPIDMLHLCIWPWNR